MQQFKKKTEKVENQYIFTVSKNPKMEPILQGKWMNIY